MKSSRGFTIIELLVVIVFIAVASVVFFVQKNHVEVAARDEARQTAINALYYSLEEVYFAENAAYPRTINAETLPSVDPALFTDPNGVKLVKAQVITATRVLIAMVTAAKATNSELFLKMKMTMLKRVATTLK